MANNANSGVPRGDVIHGARGYLTINGRRVGYVNGVDFAQTTNVLDIEVLDDLLTTEHVTAGVTFTGTISRVEIFSQSLVDAGLSIDINDVLTQAPINMAIVDRPNGEPWLSFSQVKFTGKSGNFQKGVLTVSRVNFKCISMADKDDVIGI